MNWFNSVIVSIGAAFSSLFGISHPSVSNTSSSIPVEQVAQTSQVSDEQSVINTVTTMLTGERNAVTFEDAEKAMTDYASQQSIQQFQLGISKIPASSLTAMQGYILQVDHAYPDPTSLKFNVTINGDVATATAALPDTTSTNARTINGKVAGTIVSTFQNSITVPLQKENGQWKVVKIIVASKGVGNQITQ
jgi:hypothetical protein